MKKKSGITILTDNYIGYHLASKLCSGSYAMHSPITIVEDGIQDFSAEINRQEYEKLFGNSENGHINLGTRYSSQKNNFFLTKSEYGKRSLGVEFYQLIKDFDEKKLEIYQTFSLGGHLYNASLQGKNVNFKALRQLERKAGESLFSTNHHNIDLIDSYKKVLPNTIDITTETPYKSDITIDCRFKSHQLNSSKTPKEITNKINPYHDEIRIDDYSIQRKSRLHNITYKEELKHSQYQEKYLNENSARFGEKTVLTYGPAIHPCLSISETIHLASEKQAAILRNLLNVKLTEKNIEIIKKDYIKQSKLLLQSGIAYAEVPFLYHTEERQTSALKQYKSLFESTAALPQKQITLHTKRQWAALLIGSGVQPPKSGKTDLKIKIKAREYINNIEKNHSMIIEQIKQV